MAEFKESNHVYKTFWTETYIRAIFGIKIIEEREKYQGARISDRLKSLPAVVVFISFSSHNLYDLLSKDTFSIFEILVIPLFVMFMLLLLSVWIEVKKMKEALSTVIELLQFMDQISIQHFHYGPRKHLISMNLLLFVLFLHMVVIGPIFIVLYFALPQSRYFMSLGDFLLVLYCVSIISTMHQVIDCRQNRNAEHDFD